MEFVVLLATRAVADGCHGNSKFRMANLSYLALKKIVLSALWAGIFVAELGLINGIYQTVKAMCIRGNG